MGVLGLVHVNDVVAGLAFFSEAGEFLEKLNGFVCCFGAGEGGGERVPLVIRDVWWFWIAVRWTAGAAILWCLGIVITFVISGSWLFLDVDFLLDEANWVVNGEGGLPSWKKFDSIVQC